VIHFYSNYAKQIHHLTSHRSDKTPCCPTT